jgi:glycosyltransferase involved in cell wall biosynthesis
MACGIPVVTTRVGGISEIVTDGRNGFMVPIRDPKAIAAAIMKLLENDDLRVEMGRNARRTVEEDYSWDVVANKALKYYHSLAG